MNKISPILTFFILFVSCESAKEGKNIRYWNFWGGQKKIEYNLAYDENNKLQIDGLNIHWHKNGQKAYQGNYKLSKRTGKHFAWYENGQKEYERNYINDLHYGEQKFWDKDGWLEKKVFYQVDDTSRVEDYIIESELAFIKYNKEGEVVYKMYDGSYDERIKDSECMEKALPNFDCLEPFKVPKYAGTHKGRWEGFLLNQLNAGNAKFEVKSNGNATLSMTGKFNATHTGKVKGDKFITDKNQTCSIVDLGGGNFKVVLIWTGVNVDVMF